MLSIHLNILDHYIGIYAVQYHITDHLGSVRVLLNQSKAYLNIVV